MNAISFCPLRTVLILSVSLCAAASAADMWKPKGEPSEFVADWSKADQADAAASKLFIEKVWPKVKPAAAALDGKILVNKKPVETGKVYAGAMSDAEKSAGVVCFPLTAEAVVPWYAVPSDAMVAGRKLSVLAAQGQSEAVAVGVHAIKDVAGVAVSCSDLAGPGTIPASAITTRLSLSYTVDLRGRGKDFQARQMVLLNTPAWDIPKAQTQSWVVDVHVPVDAKAGNYAGKITVRVGQAVAATFDLALEVLPFRLTDNGVRFGNFMTPNPADATAAWCDVNSRYGFNTLAWWKLDTPNLTWTWDGRKDQQDPIGPDSINSLDFAKDAAFDAYDAGMKRLKSYGFPGPITWFGAGKTIDPWEIRVIANRFGVKYSRKGWAWKPQVVADNTNHLWYLANAAVAKSFAQARTKYGWPEVVWCPVDESFDITGKSGRSAPNMMAEMMPYIRKFAPEARIYTVVWHTKPADDKGLWQCGVLQKIDKDAEGKPSQRYGPYQVICTNCPNDLDRQTTWDAGGEYWMYTMAYSVLPSYSAARFGIGFKGARHYAAVVYNYADSAARSNLADDADAAVVAKSDWIGGEARVIYYLSDKPGNGATIDHAIASHTALALRSGITDRKYVETLRVLAHAKKSAEDIAFLDGLGARIDTMGGGKGGVDDFMAEVKDESSTQSLRREIAGRIGKLISRP